MPNHGRDSDHYTRLFIVFFGQVSGVFRKTLTILCIALCLFQLVLRIDIFRPFISPVDRLEGEPLSDLNVNDWTGGKR